MGTLVVDIESRRGIATQLTSCIKIFIEMMYGDIWLFHCFEIVCILDASSVAFHNFWLTDKTIVLPVFKCDIIDLDICFLLEKLEMSCILPYGVPVCTVSNKSSLLYWRALHSLVYFRAIYKFRHYLAQCIRSCDSTHSILKCVIESGCYACKWSYEIFDLAL